MKTRIKFFDGLKQLCIIELDMSGRITDCYPMLPKEWNGVRIDIGTIRLFQRPKAYRYDYEIDIEWYVIYIAVDPGVKPWDMLPKYYGYISTNQLLSSTYPYKSEDQLLSRNIMVLVDGIKETMKSWAINNPNFDFVEVVLDGETKCYLLPKSTSSCQ